MRWGMVAVVLGAVMAGACATTGPAGSADREMRAGVRAAVREYWQEAHFRFARARRLEPDNPKILNNMAVALEALGRYEEALEVYKEALQKAPSNSALKRNHSRFAEFYTSLARGVTPKEAGDAKP
jgi:tetratricopeptide (TPR) repeat protein